MHDVVRFSIPRADRNSTFWYTCIPNTSIFWEIWTFSAICFLFLLILKNFSVFRRFIIKWILFRFFACPRFAILVLYKYYRQCSFIISKLLSNVVYVVLSWYQRIFMSIKVYINKNLCRLFYYNSSHQKRLLVWLNTD